MPVAEAFGDIAWVRDGATDEVLYMSPGSAAFYGLDAESVSLPAIFALIHPDDRPRIAALRGAMEGGVVRVDFRFFRRGELRYAETRARAVLDADGRLLRTEGVVSDITDRVRAEEAARAEARRSAALLAVAQRLAAQRGVAAVGRLLCEELLGVLPVHGVALRTAADGGEPFVTAAIAGTSPGPPGPMPRARYERIIAALGPTAHVHDVLDEPLFAADAPMFRELGLRTLVYTSIVFEGRLVGLLVGASFGEPVDVPPEALELLRAIGELGALAIRNAELHEAQRATAERYRTIVETAAEGIAVIDTDHVIRFANPQLAAMVGRTVDEIVGQNAERFFPVEDIEDRRRSYAARISGHLSTTRARLVANDGRHVDVLSNSSVVVENGEPKGLLVLVTDVTELTRLEDQVQQARKLESLGVLAGGIAHDFNNLLVSILGNAGLALLDLPLDSPVHEVVAEVQTAALRAADLTKQLLAYSGKGRFVLAKVDLGRIVEDMATSLAASVGKGVLLDLQFAPGLPPIEADATQVRQLLSNLVTNASEALREGGGTVRIATSLVHADRDDLAGTYVDDTLPPGDFVALEVSDTGTGMSDDARSKIFDPFFTTKFTGRGLGLAATLGIVRAHKGAVKVESELGRGTTFRVLFPAVDAAPASEVAPMTPLAHPDAGGLVLVVDDEEGVRNVARRILERAGYRVMTAVDGRDGVDVFEVHAAEIDLVLLDVTMPRMGGEQAFQELRSVRADVPVILSSGFTEGEATSRFAGKGLAGFLEKPFTPRSMMAKVREALGR
jgi:PAS domain S-box-containing protein